MSCQFALSFALFASLGIFIASGSTPPAWLLASSTVVDSTGNLYAVGEVSSDTVPVTPGAYQTHFNVGVCGYSTYGSPSNPPVSSYPIPCKHIFAAKLSADGEKIIWATYLEGSLDDQVSSIAIDAAGHLFLAGSTTSSDFPTTGQLGALAPPPGSDSNQNAFIAEISPDGARVLFSHFIRSWTTPLLIQTDTSGSLYVAGTAAGNNFPTTPGAYLQERGAASLDGFVLKMDPASDTLVYSTLIGGSDQDLTTGLAVDSVTGYTISTDFPVTPGAFHRPGVRVNVFTAKLDPTGSSLLFSSLFGGSQNTTPSHIALDRSGNVYIDGQGYSADLPVTSGALRGVHVRPEIARNARAVTCEATWSHMRCTSQTAFVQLATRR